VLITQKYNLANSWLFPVSLNGESQTLLQHIFKFIIRNNFASYNIWRSHNCIA